MPQWYVITGAPCSGKSTVLKGLAARDYTVIPEVARLYIDESLEAGIPVETLRADEVAFQREILTRKIALEAKLPRTDTLFFDRGIPDSHAYLKFLAVTDEALLSQSLGGSYAKVFLLDPCPYKADYARTESPEDQMTLHHLLREAYEKARFEIVSVPVFETKDARVDFILKHL